MYICFSLEQVTMVHYLFFTCYNGYKKIMMIPDDTIMIPVMIMIYLTHMS